VAVGARNGGPPLTLTPMPRRLRRWTFAHASGALAAGLRCFVAIDRRVDLCSRTRRPLPHLALPVLGGRWLTMARHGAGWAPRRGWTFAHDQSPARSALPEVDLCSRSLVRRAVSLAPRAPSPANTGVDLPSGASALAEGGPLLTVARRKVGAFAQWDFAHAGVDLCSRCA
jgi:hypothetical protein